MKPIAAVAFLIVLSAGTTLAQETKIVLSADSTRFIKLQLFAQFWARYNESNPGTEVQGEIQNTTLDIGVRRARVQAYLQLNNRASLFLHYGANNVNTNFNIGSNRKIQAFFHDIFGEYNLLEEHQLKLGAGLTFVNGLSRFSQPAVIAMPTMDIPVFGQATVEQIDVFGRKLSLTARGQIGPIDYRFSLSDPFPVTSTGVAQPALSETSNFAQRKHNLQRQAYVIYQFLDHEPHQVPNMAGTYYGTKSVLNIAAGVMHQPNAMWRRVGRDTVFEEMLLMAVESMYDCPISANGTTLTAYLGVFNNNYGKDYIRYNGIMNPATASVALPDSIRPPRGVGASYGNAFPMFGTGTVVYSHLGMMFPNVIGKNGVLPYILVMNANYTRLGLPMTVYGAGVSLLMDSFKTRLTLDIQNRPTFYSRGEILVDQLDAIYAGPRKTQVVLQYQLVF